MVNVFVISAKMDFLDWMPIMGWDVLIANVIQVVQIFHQVKEQFVTKILANVNVRQVWKEDNVMK